MVYWQNSVLIQNNYSIIFRVSDAVIIPITFDFFVTRIHFEYLINGTKTFAGVSKSTIGGMESIVSDSFAFFNSASPDTL